MRSYLLLALCGSSYAFTQRGFIGIPPALACVCILNQYRIWLTRDNGSGDDSGGGGGDGDGRDGDGGWRFTAWQHLRSYQAGY